MTETQSQQAGGDNPRHLAPTGDLTIFEAGEFKDALVKLFANEGLVSLDLAGVKRVDTAAVQLLLSARKEQRMLVAGLSEEIQGRLTQLGFSGSLSE
jgi:anti-anti-sigma regulatory factor